MGSISFLDSRTNMSCVEAISQTKPSDYIVLSSKEDAFIMNLWEANLDKTNLQIPSDIFFAHTVPLLDCIISVEDALVDNQFLKYRVVVFEDYQKSIQAADKFNSAVVVGAVIPYGIDEIPALFFIPITVKRGNDGIVWCGVGYFTSKAKSNLENSFLREHDFQKNYFMFMETWYGIQIALLHPEVKQVFSKPTLTTIDNQKDKKGKRKRSVKYIKKHVITLEKLNEISDATKRKFHRKCLAWYVIGHWRTYSDGRKVFIKPYWKGLLRETKRNADGDDRERKMNIA